ncbi:MAG TPA: trehalase family glycosidase [Bacteroidota bacterium]|nr:trehalase family glycosidase [Bacteroidota bacterium]
MARGRDILRLLQRTDKHTLGGGNRLIWAPPVPLFTASAGLWDEAHYLAYPVRPLFTWTLLDGEGRGVLLRPGVRRWDPSAFSRTYAGECAGRKLTVRETLCILPSDVACCELALAFHGRGKATLHLVAWTAVEEASGEADAAFHADAIRFTRKIGAAESPPLTIGAAFGLAGKPHSYALARAGDPLPPPSWTLTPLADKFVQGRLSGTVPPPGGPAGGTLFMALHRELEVRSGEVARETLGLALGAQAEKDLREAFRGEGPCAASAAHWRNQFEGIPRFACSDEHIERYYWYRWYGLGLNTIESGGLTGVRPLLCEGPGERRAPFAASAPYRMLENRWRHDPAPARASLLGFLERQREDGALPGAIGPAPPAGEGFTHADWGSALLQLDAVHHSGQFLRQVHAGLARYAKYLDGARDPEGSGLYDVFNDAETGMEYMHRYTAVREDADTHHGGRVFRLKGVDATVYVYALKRALALFTRDLGKPGEAEILEIEADKIRNAVRSRMWNQAEEMFFDVDAGTSAQTMVKAVSCFLPYCTDIVSAEHLGGLRRHLFNTREFWTPRPVPSTPADDETFCAEPEWKGRRVARPWNGRVWPPANSQVAEAIARSAIVSGDADLRQKAAEFIRTFIRMMFFDGDAGRPNSFEHYHPSSGTPSLYRGIDDCQHSSVVDLIIRYVCGIRPARDALVVDPFPFGLVSASIDGVMVCGRRVKVEIARKRFTAWIDGKEAGSGTLGSAMAFPLV